MKNCAVALGANAGISLALGQQRIWIDAVHISGCFDGGKTYE